MKRHPAEAGAQCLFSIVCTPMDSGFRRNDGCGAASNSDQCRIRCSADRGLSLHLQHFSASIASAVLVSPILALAFGHPLNRPRQALRARVLALGLGDPFQVIALGGKPSKAAFAFLFTLNAAARSAGTCGTGRIARCFFGAAAFAPASLSAIARLMSACITRCLANHSAKPSCRSSPCHRAAPRPSLHGAYSSRRTHAA